MSKATIYYAWLIKEECWANFYINDLPLYRAPGPGSNSRGGPVNDLLIPGENKVTIELLRVKAPVHSDHLEDAVWMRVFEPVDINVQPMKVRMVHETTFPQLMDGAPTKYRRTPFYYEATFEHGVDELPRPVFLDAPEADFGCDGTPALRDAVMRVQDALLRGDADAFFREIQLKLNHYESAFFSDPEKRAEFKRKAFRDDLFAYNLTPEPLDPAELHFEARRNGQVAYVRRKDGSPALQAVCKDEPTRRLRTDIMLTQYAGDWRVFF